VLDIDKIRKLIEMMVTNDLVEISLRDGEEEVNLRRPSSAAAVAMSEAVTHVHAANPGLPSTGQLAAEPTVGSKAEDDSSGLVEIASPMVGTYYAASDPEAPPFVNIGQQVQVGMVVCILEAMKVFNEIKSEVAGTIERILVNNAEPVEFGQTLFLVRPQ